MEFPAKVLAEDLRYGRIPLISQPEHEEFLYSQREADYIYTAWEIKTAPFVSRWFIGFVAAGDVMGLDSDQRVELIAQRSFNEVKDDLVLHGLAKLGSSSAAEYVIRHRRQLEQPPGKKQVKLVGPSRPQPSL